MHPSPFVSSAGRWFKTSVPFVRLLATTLAIAMAMCALLPAGSNAQSFSTQATFNGEVGGSLSESMIAVGPDRILEVTPQWVVFYTKTGGVISRTHINTFFADQLGQGEAVAGDPVCYYDALRGRYLMAAMGAVPNTEMDKTFLWISKDNSDPTNPANWWKYRFIDYRRDYPGLGVSDDKVALRVDNNNKTYVFDRAMAYGGQYPNDPGLTPIYIPTVAWVKPCRNITSDSTVHLVARSISGGAEYFKLTGPATDPVVTGPLPLSIMPIEGLFGEIGTEQPDTSLFNSCEPRLLRGHIAAPMPETYMRNGNITMTWTVERNYGDGSPSTSAIRVVRFRTNDQAVLDDFQIGRPGMTYAFGSAVEDNHGTIFVGYDRYSPNEWPACYMVARRSGHQSPEFLVKASFTSYGTCIGGCTPMTSAAWGDYTSIVVDEFATTSNLTTVRYVGEWAPNFTTSGTAIGTMRAAYGTSGISGTVRSGGSGVPGVPVELVESGVLIARAETNSNGIFGFSLVPTGTYLVRMALDPAVATGAIVGGGGAVLSNTEILITVEPDAISIGNQFNIASQPTPAIDSISVSVVPPTQASFDLVVYGQNFRPYSRVRIDGRDKVTTYNGPSSLTARVLHHDVARTGPNTVTVYTPAAPAPGTSNVDTITTFRPPIIVSQIVNTNVAACPAGDGGRATGTIVFRHTPPCLDGPTLETKGLTIYNPGLKAWGLTSLYPPFPVYSIPTQVSYSDSTQLATVTFDFGTFSGCGTVSTSLVYRSSADTFWKAIPLTFDIRSFDLNPLVHGSVDRFDNDALGALMGTSQPCGDFNFDGTVSLSDIALFSTHMGHHYQERRVITPNGGESFVRSGGGYTIPIAWLPGEGDSATVTLKQVRNGVVSTIAANVPDTGEYDWGVCSVPNGTNYRVEVVHTAGTFQAGHATLGSDRSDTTFAISGSCGGGGCPFLDTWTAEQWKEENSILGRSRDGTMVRDLYRLTANPDVQGDGTIRLRVRESENEQTRLARAELVVVDRAPSQVSGVVAGRIVIGDRMKASRVTSSTGGDLTPLFSGSNALGYEGSPGEVINVELWDGSEDMSERLFEGRFGGTWITGVIKTSARKAPRTGAQYDREVLEETGIVVERLARDGKWVPVDHIYPREHRADLGVVGARVLRLRFIGRHRIEGIGWFRLADRQATPVTLSPTSARHSQLEDVLPRLTSSEGEVLLSPGEDIELAYPLPHLADGLERDYYFAARGVYTTLATGSGPVAADLPTKLELLAPKPNPTRGSPSVIGFALPSAGRVQIRVFDAQGRVVRTLLDERREPGRHQVIWNTRDVSGRLVPSGIYFYRMNVGSWRQERKVIVSN